MLVKSFSISGKLKSKDRFVLRFCLLPLFSAFLDVMSLNDVAAL